jgi:hypothetical protein
VNIRCRCRPGCLTWLKQTDDLVITVDGAALASHLNTPAVDTDPQEPRFELAAEVHG